MREKERERERDGGGRGQGINRGRRVGKEKGMSTVGVESPTAPCEDKW